MPSRPSGPSPPWRASSAHRTRRFALWPVVSTLLALAVSCAPPSPRAPAPALPPDLRAYLISPAHGYPLALDAPTSQLLDEGFRRLLQGEWEAAWSIARGLEEEVPGLAPAQVLAGQALLVARRPGEVHEVAASALERHPGYLAAQLLLGRAAETRGDLLEAFDLYTEAALVSEVAERQAALLRPRALEISSQRARDAVRRGRLEEAEESLARLERWAPEEEVTFEVAVEVARARGDRHRELQALRVWTRTASERELLERRGELELQVGDAAAGLEIFQALQERYPDDPVVADQVASAKFRWRLQVLPQEVQEKVRRQELTRADFAVLLYWLVPGVRTAAPQVARIATDVSEHPHRSEIIRVVNLQLMDLDEALRRFEPDRPVRRITALAALLGALARDPQAPACLDALEGATASSPWVVCTSATRCGLFRDEGDCLPDAGVSGTEALEWIRRMVTH